MGVRAKGTARFKRGVQVRDGHPVEAAIEILVDADFEELPGALKAAFVEAKTIVFAELGIEYELVDGLVREKITQHFGPVAEVAGDDLVAALDASSPKAPAPWPARPRQGGGKTYPDPCPKCNGEMWDNRETKTSPRQPDARCKGKTDAGCDGIIWPPKGGK